MLLPPGVPARLLDDPGVGTRAGGAGGGAAAADDDVPVLEDVDGGGLADEHELGVCLLRLNFMLRKLDSEKSLACPAEDVEGGAVAEAEVDDDDEVGGGGAGFDAEVGPADEGVAGEAEFLLGELESDDFLRLSTSVA